MHYCYSFLHYQRYQNKGVSIKTHTNYQDNRLLRIVIINDFSA